MNISGEKAWAILGLGVLGYELTAKEEQLLSEAVDRFILRHPWITRAVVVYLAAHLLNLVPDRFDPLHQLALRRLGLPWGTRTSQIGVEEAQRGAQGAATVLAVAMGIAPETCQCEDCSGDE